MTAIARNCPETVDRRPTPDYRRRARAPFSCLHRGSGTTIGRWDCAHPGREWSPEEATAHHEMIVPLRGVWIRRFRGTEQVGSPNVALFANPGDVHQVRHPDGVPDVNGVVQFSEAAMEDLARATGAVGQAAFKRDAGSLTPAGFLRFQMLFEAIMRGRRDSIAVEEIAADLAVEALSERSSPTDAAASHHARREHLRAVQRAEEFLSVQFRTNLSLADVAREAGYSPFHFARVFRAHVGLSVHTYTARLRLRAALDAVLAGEADLSSLAHRLGFSSHSHFTYAFRREFDTTPLRVRKAGRRAAALPARHGRPS